jgi:serine/threonine protein kinase
MPSPTTNHAFLEMVQQSGLVDSAYLDAHVRGLEEASALPAAPRLLADRLVADGLLTGFQTHFLLQGRFRGLVVGKYKVLEPLGQGGMGRVYLCEHVAMGHRVALKLLAGVDRNNCVAIERFFREARASAALNHPNIVRAHDIDHDGKYYYLIMDYVDGVSLQGLVERLGALDPARAAHYAAQAARGLQQVHEAGLVHRDIKPSNLLLDRQGTIKILDMGLARFQDDDRREGLTQKYQAKQILGTADYLSPEQAIKSHQADIRADIYSLGATLYFLLAGRAPFQGNTAEHKIVSHLAYDPEPLVNVRGEVPAELSAVVSKMMAKDPGQRYQTPAEVVAALAPWTATPIPPPSEKEIPPARVAVSRPTSGAISSSTMLSTPRRHPSRSGVGHSADTTVEPRGSLDTRLVKGSRGRKGQPSRPRRSVLVGAFATLGVVLGVGAVATVLSAGRQVAATAAPETGAPRSAGPVAAEPAKASPVPTSGFVRLARGATSGTTHASLREALSAASPGDRIVVREAVVQEAMWIDSPQCQDVTVEAEPGRMPPTVWRTPASLASKDPLVGVAGVPGFRIKGPFVFEGNNTQEKLIVLAGDSPGAGVEDVELRQWRWCALQLYSCRGNAQRPVTLTGIRAVAPADHRAGIVLESEANNPIQATRHVIVRDCRLEGALQGALLLRGEVTDVSVEGNRFHSAAMAVRASDRTTEQLSLTFANNTFAGCAHGLYFDKAPDGNVALTLRDNLFVGVPRFAAVAGMRLQPLPEQARCQEIWTDEFDKEKGVAPSGDRFFRKVFTLPAGDVASARLELFADDLFVAWVNGKKVGEGGVTARRVYAFDVGPHLVPGRNVLAVKATNLNQGAGLAAQLTVEPAGGTGLSVITDETWKVTQGTTEEWLRSDYDDSNWPSAVAVAVPAAGALIRGDWLTWDRVVREQFAGAGPKLVLEGNVSKGVDGGEGYPYLSPAVSWEALDLSTDPGNNATFLRYPRGHKLATAGARGGPVGVPPEEMRRAAEAGKAGLLFRLDFGSHPPFKQRIDLGKVVQPPQGAGSLPPEWACDTWSEDTAAETMVEKVEGATGLGLRNLSGKSSLQLRSVNPVCVIAAGRPFTLRVEYLTQGAARPMVRLDNGGWPNTIASHSPELTGGRWRTFEATMTYAKDIQAALVVQNLVVGAADVLYIRSIEIVQGPTQPQKDLLYRLDIQDRPPFNVRMRGFNVAEKSGSGSLPQSWQAHCWKQESLGEFFLAPAAGADALGFRNLEGDHTAEFMTDLAGALKKVRPGKNYLMKIEYRTEGVSGACALLHRDSNYTTVAQHTLPPTNGAWQTTEWKFQLEKEERVHMVIHNYVTGAGNTLFVKALELSEVE